MLLSAKIIDSLVLARTASHRYAGILRHINLSKHSPIQNNFLLREMMTGFAHEDGQDLTQYMEFT